MALNAQTNTPKNSEDRREDERFGTYAQYYREKWELVSEFERGKIRVATEEKGGLYDEANPKEAIVAHLLAQLELMKAERRAKLLDFKVQMVAKYNQGKAGRREMVMRYSSTYGMDDKFEVYDYVLFEKKDYGDNNVTGLFKAGKQLKADKKEMAEKGEIPFMKEKGEIKMSEQQVVSDLDMMFIIDDVFEENCSQLRYLMWVEKLCSARRKNKLPHFRPLKPNNLRRKVNMAISVIGAAVTIGIIVA